MTIMENRLRFIREVIAGRIALPLPRAKVEEYLDQSGYASVEGFGYLLEMKMAALTEEAIEKLESQLHAARERHMAHTKMAPGEMMAEGARAVARCLGRGYARGPGA
jgi:hypothetical protein